MCLLCNDEEAYQAYMDYFDAMQRQGEVADPEKAIGAVLDQLQAADNIKATMRREDFARNDPARDDPANDKTLSPFFCSPVNK